MSERLNEEQLQQIVVEVGELSQRQTGEFDRQQIQEILRELNLPPELLDEAIIQLRRRQALQQQQNRTKKIAAGTIAVILIAIVSFVFLRQQYNSAIANVGVQQDRITLPQDNGGNLTAINRQNNPQLFYRVTLKDAPLGKNLNLACNWINPSGQIVKQNQYQTQEINTQIWNTRCRYQIGTSAKPGQWKVEMLLDGRVLSEEIFTVE